LRVYLLRFCSASLLRAGASPILQNRASDFSLRAWFEQPILPAGTGHSFHT
jgi:hypothetical protein